MKRDMDLARQILINIELCDDDPNGWIEVNIPDRTKLEISYHIMILAEAGLIEAEDLCSFGDFDYRAKRLTWDGHEFLDAARSDSLWERAKRETLKQTGGLAFDILKAALSRAAMQAIGMP